MLPEISRYDAPLDADAITAIEPIPAKGPAWFGAVKDHASATVAFTPHAGVGSNAWSVEAAQTTQRRAIVANDMHLGLHLPNIWFRLSLAYGAGDGTHLVGVSLPGTPLMVVGSNGPVTVPRWPSKNSARALGDTPTGTRLHLSALRQATRIDATGNWVAGKPANAAMPLHAR